MSPIDPRLLGNHVDGEWQPAQSGQVRPNHDPGNVDDHLGDFAESGGADAEAAVDAASRALPAWGALGAIARAEILRRAGRLIEQRREEFAATITREQGKRLVEARGEVGRSLAILDFTVGEARRLNGVTTPAEDPRTVAMTFRRPIGVVGLITPWNFPLAIPLWKVAPALVAGCTAVLKPSPFTPLTAALLVRALQDVGLPPGVLNLVQGDRAVGEALVDHPEVAGISFTGSFPVGQAIQQTGAPRLLRTQLELGGKNAVVVLPDADLDAATDAIVHGAFGQAGQRCSATSRVVVDAEVEPALLDRLATRVRAMRVGHGTDDRADIGPVVNEDRLEACLHSVETATDAGADIVCGGRRATSPDLPRGWYVEPTILRDVPWDAPIAQEEIFGPVLSVIRCEGFDQAVEFANSVRYGMSATLFTSDVTRAFEALDRLEAGMLHINRPGVGAYAHLPHVGTKDSQYGPPECSPQVWDFYTEWRSACIRY
ncbi:MAG TPA: aldehyde dehydrogenase family protein [Actinopolymorphaceae bacterium]